jgi:hypothetical protein
VFAELVRRVSQRRGYNWWSAPTSMSKSRIKRKREN